MSTYYVVLTLPEHEVDPDPAEDRASVAAFVDYRLGEQADSIVYSSFDDLAADHADGVA